MNSSRNMYAIVLAADEDTSLDPLTRALSTRPVPKQYAFIDAIPKTSVLKFDKKELRKMFADGKLEVKK